MLARTEPLIITGLVYEGEYKGSRVFLHRAGDDDGWQWGPHEWVERFNPDDDRFENAMAAAKKALWEGGCGPWHFAADPHSVEAAPYTKLLQALAKQS